MRETKLVVKNETGLHARPASLVVSEANKFKSSVMAAKNGKEVNLKSILGLLSLGVAKGDEITIKAEGADENEAVEAIARLIESFKD